MINNKIEKYDGSLIHNRFAYRYFRDKVLPIGNIIAFIAPMEVETEGMIDLEDVLNEDFIYSDNAINFVWEIPNIDTFGAIAFQRLFNVYIADLLKIYADAPVTVDGDDIFVHKQHNQGGIIQPKGKASVSITYVKNGAALGHTAININAGKRAPAFAYSVKEFENKEQATEFMGGVIDCFYSTLDDIFVASTKTI